MENTVKNNGINESVDINPSTTTPITNKYDFVVLWDCADGNPNGDPDGSNAPRQDPETYHGLVSDSCFKRKLRNTWAANGHDIFVKDQSFLNTTLKSAFDSTGVIALEKDREKEVKSTKNGSAADKSKLDTKKVIDFLCKNFTDIRHFGGATFTGKFGLDGIQGPVQVTLSRSIDPIAPVRMSITRVCKTDAADVESGSDDSSGHLHGTFGEKWFIPYGLYKTIITVSPYFAKRTNFSEEDVSLLISSIKNMFNNDRASGRVNMNIQKIIVFKHESAEGNASLHKLVNLVKVQKNPDVVYPRSFNDYSVTIDENPYKNVTITDESANL